MSRLSLKSSRRRLGIALALPAFLLVCFAALSHSSTPGQAAAAAGAATHAAPAESSGKGCRSCLPAGDQLIYLPLAELPEARGGGELVFNSRSPKEMDVTPTFYKLDGTAVVGDPVRVKSGEIRYVDVKKLLPQSRRAEHDWGGLSLSFQGHSREMWAQFRFLRVNGGGSMDEFFTVRQEPRSDVQQAAWWVPRASTSIIALGNLTDAPTGAFVKFGDGSTRAVTLAPHATEVIRRANAAGGTDSVSVTTTGASGSVIPTGFIASRDGSFNGAIRFHDTKGARQPRLFANGLRLKGVTPHMVLKNTSDSALSAAPKFIPAAAAEAVLLPEVSLGPGETREVDLSPLTAAAGRSDLDVVSVEVGNSGAPGSLIGSLYGAGRATGTDYEVPLRDSGPSRSMTGSYPWKVDKDFTTVVYITNISDQNAEFVSQINHDDGKYVFKPRKLGPGETAVIDPRRLRDLQVPDDGGQRLPKATSAGQFRWSVRGKTHGNLALIGRAEMVSRTQQVSTSYSCNDPCPPYYVLYIDGFPSFVGQFASTTSTVWEYAQYDSGFNIGPYASSATWWDDDWLCTYSCPNNNNQYVTTGQVVGDSMVTAFSRFEESYSYDGRDCYWDNNQYMVGEMGPISVVPTISVGSITVTPSVLSTSTAGTVRITLSASSGVVNTQNVSVEVGIIDASGAFSLNFDPQTQAVNLGPGQSQTYTFAANLTAAPAANRTCKFTAHVNVPANAFTVVNNDRASDTVTILAN